MATRSWYLIKAVMFRLSVVLAIVSWSAVGVLAFKQENDPEAIGTVGGNLAEICFIGN